MIDKWQQYLMTMAPDLVAPGLERIASVAEALNFTGFSCPVITVTGTNGKGSCVAFLEAILLQAGYRVAAYTSPHMFTLNERVKINGAFVTDDVLIGAFSLVEKARGAMLINFFEFITLAAFYIFTQHPLDIIILEVGIGGRLDAVNLVAADIAIITTIAIDHTDRLGNTRAMIGKEKAGIFRAGRKAVCGDPKVPHTVLKHAANLRTSLAILGQHFNYISTGNVWQWYGPNISFKDLPVPRLALQNAASSIMALTLLPHGFNIPEAAIRKGLQSAYLAGRFERLPYYPQLIFDVAHNPQACNRLSQLLTKEPCSGRTIAVVGMLIDKDIEANLKTMVALVDAWYIGDLATPRGAPAELIANKLKKLTDKPYFVHTNIVASYENAGLDCRNDDRIVIFGSFYTVAQVQKWLQSNSRR